MGISFPWIRKRGGVIEGGKAQDGDRGRGRVSFLGDMERDGPFRFIHGEDAEEAVTMSAVKLFAHSYPVR